jgi:hypothetical protein
MNRQISLRGMFGFVAVSAIVCAMSPLVGAATSVCGLVIQGMLLLEHCMFDNAPNRLEASNRQR